MPKNLDHIFRQSLDDLEAPVGPEAWERLSPHLPRQKRPFRAKRWLGGVTLVILLSLPLLTHDSYSSLGAGAGRITAPTTSTLAVATPTLASRPTPSPEPPKSQNLPSKAGTSILLARPASPSLAPKAPIANHLAVSAPGRLYALGFDSLLVETLSPSPLPLARLSVPLTNPIHIKRPLKPWRFHVSLGSHWLYQHLWPNQHDQVLITGFQPVPSLSLNRLNGSLELGVSRAWRTNFAWEASFFLAHFQHEVLFDQAVYGTYVGVADPGSPSGKINLTPKPRIQPGQSLNLSGWTWGGGLKVAWTPDRHRFSLGIRYVGQYFHVVAENRVAENRQASFDPGLARGRWQTVIQYDYRLAKLSRRWDLSMGPELGYTLGVRSAATLSMGVQPYWWGVRLTLNR